MTLDQCIEALSLMPSFCKCTVVQYSMVTTPSKGVHSQAILVVCQKKSKATKDCETPVQNGATPGFRQVCFSSGESIGSKSLGFLSKRRRTDFWKLCKRVLCTAPPPAPIPSLFLHGTATFTLRHGIQKGLKLG